MEASKGYSVTTLIPMVYQEEETTGGPLYYQHLRSYGCRIMGPLPTVGDVILAFLRVYNINRRDSEQGETVINTIVGRVDVGNGSSARTRLRDSPDGRDANKCDESARQGWKIAPLESSLTLPRLEDRGIVFAKLRD